MTSETVAATIGPVVITNLAADIDTASAYLSELDGAIGDGDHGANMRKGFELARTRVRPDMTLDLCLDIVGNTLLDDVGGAMGPLYGVFFVAMSSAAAREEIDSQCFEDMLARGVDAVVDLGGAKVGDKTLIDVLAPASDAYASCRASGRDFIECLFTMVRVADERRDATKPMVARLGRSSRVGERAVGHIDAGAASSAVILRSIATTLVDAIPSTSS